MNQLLKKLALSEYGMNTNLDDFHEYQDRVDVITC